MKINNIAIALLILFESCDSRKPHEYFVSASKFLDDGVALETAGQRLNAEEKFKLAIDAYTNGLRDSANSEGYADRGWCYFKMQEYDKAIQDFEKGISLDSKNTSCYNGRANVYDNKGDLKSAIADYSLCINLDPNEDLYYNRGITFIKISDFDGAMSDFNKAIELNPKSYHGYIGRAFALSVMGKYESALNDFNSALSLEGSSAYIYLQRATIYEFLGNHSNSESDYNIYKNLTNDDAEEFIGLSWSMMVLGRFNEAIGLANQAIKLRGDEGGYYDTLGDIYTNMSDLENAETAYRKARQLGAVGARFYGYEKPYSQRNK